MTLPHTRRRSALAAMIAGVALAGCSQPPKQEDTAAVNLRRIVQAYDIAEYKLHRPPRNEDELKRFLGETGATVVTAPRLTV